MMCLLDKADAELRAAYAAMLEGHGLKAQTELIKAQTSLCSARNRFKFILGSVEEQPFIQRVHNIVERAEKAGCLP